MKRIVPSLVCFSAALISAAGELDVAKEALRDGLWEVARNHASRIEGDEAKLVILESYCREERWSDAKKMLGVLSVPDSPHFLYYKALILFNSGNTAEALTQLSLTNVNTKTLSPLVSRLKSRIAMTQGKNEEALKILRESGSLEDDIESGMMAADIFSILGEKARAAEYWQRALKDTNATERVFVTAAVNLEDVASLRSAYARVKDSSLRRMAGFCLGKVLIKSRDTFAEGDELICAIVKDAPDSPGASEVFVNLADRHLEEKRFKEARDVYRQAVEIWPKLALHSHVQHGLGWAFRLLGENDEAMKAFVRAEETSTNDVGRATAILEQGDVLSEMGRGEEALARYRLVLEKYPKTPAGEKLKIVVGLRELEAQGRDAYKNYDFATAQKKFTEVARKDPTRKFRMEYYAVLCLYGLGMDQDALTRARALADESSDRTVTADVTLWLAKFSYNRRWWKEALKKFLSYVEMRPNAADAPIALVWAAKAAFAENDFERTIQTVSSLAEKYPSSPEKAKGCLVQGEALIELARFDEAVLVMDRTIALSVISPMERIRASVLRADALFAMGADNPIRYRSALSAYQNIRQKEELPAGLKIAVAFKISRTLEKLNRLDEAIDQYYTDVVLAYRAGRIKGEHFDDEARAAFSRAAFRLADEYESRGKDFQAMHILELVVASDVPASDEAERRIDRIQTKGRFL